MGRNVKNIFFTILLLFLVFLSLFFFAKYSSFVVEAWYNSSWFYRKPVTITNGGSLLTNEDVLIVVDSATLISNSKLQTDCDDFRFTDSDGSTLISYWIEGGCNTSSTQIWVRVPSVPTGNKTIYMYYGNPAATLAEQSWSGNFILFADASCPASWTRNSTFDSRFIYGSSTYGSTGGVAVSHNHGGTLSVATGGASVTGGVGGSVEQPCTNLTTATHTISGTIGYADSSPSYLTTILCQRNKLSNLGNLILLSDSTTPSGWTRMTAFDSKFPYGSASYGTSGGTTTHTHGLSSLTSGQSAQDCSAEIDPPDPKSRWISNPTHTHPSVVTDSNSSSSNLPSYKILLYVKSPTGLVSLNQTLISPVSVLPPLGWNGYTTLNSVFVMGGATANLTTQGASTHNHSATFTLQASTTYISKNASSMLRAAPNHTHTASYTYTSTSLLPPYTTIIYASRKTSLSSSLGTEENANTAPTAPTIPYTNGGTNPTGVVPSPYFSAIFNDPDTGDTGVSYQIQVNTQSDFLGTVMWDSGLQTMTPATGIGFRSPNITYGDTDLTNNGATYYWRIKFADSGGLTSPWSATAQFTMNTTPTAPTLPLTNDLTNPTGVLTSPAPYFSAIFNDPNTGDTGIQYKIEVNTNSSFTGTVMWDPGLQTMTPATGIGSRSPNITYAGSALSYGTTYYWRVSFADNHGTLSPVSTTANFRVAYLPTTPSAPTTETLTNPIKVSDLTPEFSALFNDSDTANTGAYYEIEVNTASDFGGTSMWDTDKTVHSPAIVNNNRSSEIPYAGTALTANGTIYYWRIRFWDSDNLVSSWSTTSNFRMSGPPTAPTSMLVDGQSNPLAISSTTPTFSAIYSDPNTDSATAYEIDVNSNNTFTGTVMWATGKISTTISNNNRSPNYTYAGTALTGESGTTYYWRIRFWDSDDLVSNWSATGSFVDNFKHIFISGVQMRGVQIK